jgi:hypothetical protein
MVLLKQVERWISGRFCHPFKFLPLAFIGFDGVVITDTLASIEFYQVARSLSRGEETHNGRGGYVCNL